MIDINAILVDSANLINPPLPIVLVLPVNSIVISSTKHVYPSRQINSSFNHARNHPSGTWI